MATHSFFFMEQEVLHKEMNETKQTLNTFTSIELFEQPFFLLLYPKKCVFHWQSYIRHIQIALIKNNNLRKKKCLCFLFVINII